MYCKYCGEKVPQDANVCPYCGRVLKEGFEVKSRPQPEPKKAEEAVSESIQQQQAPMGMPDYEEVFTQHAIEPEPTLNPNSNGMATAGFVLGLVSLFAGWTIVPIVLGILFSIVGLIRSKKMDGVGAGKAIGGLIMSGIGIISMIIVFVAIKAAVPVLWDNIKNLLPSLQEILNGLKETPEVVHIL